jgi:fatty-acid peroxygenase
MTDIPKSTLFDESMLLLTEGYRFIQNRCRALGCDVFQTRLLRQRTVCLKGEDAARLFYDETLFTREKAAPLLLQTTLLGRGGVQSMDGAAHRVRKQMFLSLMSPQRIDSLVALARQEWDLRIRRWSETSEVPRDLFVEVQEIFCVAVCKWADVPLRSEDVRRVRSDLGALIDGGGSVGPRYVRSVLARRRAGRWGRTRIARTPSGAFTPAPGRALAVISAHVDDNGHPLNLKTAAVELLNVLRPTVAVAHFVLFCALRLRWQPQWKDRLIEQPELAQPFVHEVRRLYSFFPFAAARVRKTFTWRGYVFLRGRRVLLDLFGTNHDGASWTDPEAFRPERFVNTQPGPFDLVPQGGGSPDKGHRCPGEPITLALLQMAVLKMTHDMDYEAASHPADIDLKRLPMLPTERYLITSIRARRAADSYTVPLR